MWQALWPPQWFIWPLLGIALGFLTEAIRMLFGERTRAKAQKVWARELDAERDRINQLIIEQGPKLPPRNEASRES